MDIVKLPRLEKLELTQKMMIEPCALRGNIPKNKTPFLYKDGIVISLQPLHTTPALLGDTSQLKFEVTYKAIFLPLVQKYVEVEVLDEIDDNFWIGNLFGFNVHGKGGEGDVRGCQITGFQDENIKATVLDVKVGMPRWEKLKDKVEQLLAQQ